MGEIQLARRLLASIYGPFHRRMVVRGVTLQDKVPDLATEMI